MSADGCASANFASPGNRRSLLRRLLVTSLAVPSLALASSAAIVLVTPLPDDPWRNVSPPAEGEYLKMSDGALIFVRCWEAQGTARAVLMGLHALGQHSGYHARLGEALASDGHTYCALDLRGNGFTRTPHGDLSSVERQYDDLDEVATWLAYRYEAAPVLLGHSIGAAAALAWTAERQPSVSGLVLIAPAMTAEAAPIPWTNYLKGPAAWLLFRHLAVLHIDANAYHPERLAQTIDLPAEIKRAAGDRLQLRAMSMEFALAVARFRDEAITLAPGVRVPTLTIVGTRDPAIDGAQQLHGELIAPRTIILIEGGTHQLPISTALPAVVEAIDEWAASRVEQRASPRGGHE